MTKWGTYLIVSAISLMLLPIILSYFKLSTISESPFLPLLAIITGGIGSILHFINILKEKTINAQTVILLSAILAIIMGVSFQNLKTPNAKYLVLFGTLLIAIWLILPNKKKQ